MEICSGIAEAVVMTHWMSQQAGSVRENPSTFQAGRQMGK
jgi:hypothetical protein